MNGIELIAAERARQIEVERFHAAHDDDHDSGQLTRAADCYRSFAASQYLGRTGPIMCDGAPVGWPWEVYWWKPAPDPIRNLVKAAALDAAEIDRLQRAQKVEPL